MAHTLEVSDEFVAALRDVRSAMEFAEMCNKDRALAAQTGAARDAREQMVRAMCDVVSTMPELPPQD